MSSYEMHVSKMLAVGTTRDSAYDDHIPAGWTLNYVSHLATGGYIVKVFKSVDDKAPGFLGFDAEIPEGFDVDKITLDKG